MKKGLEELHSYLKNTHIKLNLEFLSNLLKDASKSEMPHKNIEFCNKIGCPINKTKKAGISIYNWKKGYKTIPFSRLIKIINLSNYSWKNIEKNLISMKAGIRKGEVYPKFPIKINEKLGSIVGHILGDGSIDKRFNSIFYSNTNIHLLKEFKDNMESIFGIKPRIWVQKRKIPFIEKSEWMKRVDNLNKVPKNHSVGLFYPKICADILHIICGEFAKGKNKKITKEIKNMNKDFQKGLIKSFFDDEGSVRSESYTIRFHQDNKIMLEEFKKLLKNFNINTNIVRSYSKKGKPRYYFNLTGFKEYYTFFNGIGCTSPKKKKEFKLLIKKVKNSKYLKKKYALPTFSDSNPRTILVNQTNAAFRT